MFNLLIYSFVKYRQYLEVMVILSSVGMLLTIPLTPNRSYATSMINSSIAIGEGASNCTANVTINIIDTAVGFLICALSPIIDSYVGGTQNLLSGSNKLSNLFISNLYTPIERISLLLIPIIFIVRLTLILIDTAIFSKKNLELYELIHSFIMNCLFIILLMPIFNISINLLNAINLSVLSLGGLHTGGLSEVLVGSITQSETLQSGILSGVVNNILWGGFFVSIVFLGIFFVVRFILIWLIFLSLPLLISLDLLHPLASYMDGVISKLIQFILIQPIFLIGIVFYSFISGQTTDIFEKIVLAICTILSLGFLPTFLAGLSGGKLAMLSEGKVMDMYKGMVGRIGLALDWMEDDVNEPYKLPFEKPEKL